MLVVRVLDPQWIYRSKLQGFASIPCLRSTHETIVFKAGIDREHSHAT